MIRSTSEESKDTALNDLKLFPFAKLFPFDWWFDVKIAMNWYERNVHCCSEICVTPFRVENLRVWPPWRKLKFRDENGVLYRHKLVTPERARFPLLRGVEHRPHQLLPETSLRSSAVYR